MQKKGKEIVDPTTSKSPLANERSNQPNVSKEKTEKKDVPAKEVEKNLVFNLENKIAKLKVSNPLTELMNNSSYKGQVSKILNLDPFSDMVNVEDDQPELIFFQHWMVSLHRVMCLLFISTLDCMIMCYTMLCFISEPLIISCLGYSWRNLDWTSLESIMTFILSILVE